MLAGCCTVFETFATQRHGAEKIIAVIVTDGRENSSRERGRKQPALCNRRQVAGGQLDAHLTQHSARNLAGCAEHRHCGRRGTFLDRRAPTWLTRATTNAVRSVAFSKWPNSNALMDDFLSEAEEHKAGMAR
jgi:hypothetical protein